MKGAFILEPSRRTHVRGEYDVAVVGGGVAGIAAALAAARNGASTCLIERSTCLGGLATLGLIVDYLPLCDGEGHQVVGGIGEELLRVSGKYAPTNFPACWNDGGDPEARKRQRFELTYEPAAFMLAVEELLLESGVRLIYDSYLCDTVRENGRITALLIENKEGRSAIRCRVAIDATGDADVCAKAGEDTVVRCDNVLSWWFYSYNGEALRLHRLTESFMRIRPGTRTYSGVNADDITHFSIESRRRIAAYIQKRNAGEQTDEAQFLLSHDGTVLAETDGEELPAPYDEKPIFPAIIPTCPEFRMTRYLRGAVMLDEADGNTWFADCIGMVGHWAKRGLVYYVPFRTLAGVQNANLLVAGRCVSATASGLDVLRVIPACAVTGQAAGTAAAVAALHRDGALSGLDIVGLRERLQSQGVLVDRAFCGHGGYRDGA